MTAVMTATTNPIAARMTAGFRMIDMMSCMGSSFGVTRRAGLVFSAWPELETACAAAPRAQVSLHDGARCEVAR